MQKRRLVVEEVRRQEEGERQAKAVSMAKQRRWTNWEGLEKKKLSWRDIWQMEGARLSFVIRATYDLLPSPQNLKEWYGEDPTCSLCQVPASLRHILSGCTTSLTQRRYTWRHNQVLRELASILEQKRTTTNNLPQTVAGQVNVTSFVPAGQHQGHRITPKDASILQSAQDWKLEVDLDRKLVFPPEIVATTLRPDMVLWSPTTKLAYVVELTVPWEEGVEEAYERKKNKYSDLATEASQNSWKTSIFPVEVGCRGFVATSTTSLLRKIGLKGRSLQQAVKYMSSAAEKEVTGFGLSVRIPSGQQGRDRWYAVRLRPDSGRRTPLPCRVHQGYRGYGMEGGVPFGGYTVEPSGDIVGFNQRNVDEAGCPPDDPNDILYPPFLFFTTPHRLLLSRD